MVKVGASLVDISEFSRGPCEVNEYLVLEGNTTFCVDSGLCEAGWVFWPRDQTCYQLYTQGPCHKGDLLIRNPDTAEPYCGCDSVLLHQYYYSPLKLCYEHFTKGPCELGSLFTYNHSSQTTDCGCDPSYPSYFKPLGQCFQLGSKGPWGPGQVGQDSPGTRYSTIELCLGLQTRHWSVWLSV